MNTHGLTIEFGKHKGELFTRLPVSYLSWMIKENLIFTQTLKRELCVMIVTTRKRKRYVVNTGTGMKKVGNGWSNYCEFGCLKAAIRYFRRHPNRDQIDVRGVKNPRCLYRKVKGRIRPNT